jgi:hypothetical protein
LIIDYFIGLVEKHGYSSVAAGRATRHLSFDLSILETSCICLHGDRVNVLIANQFHMWQAFLADFEQISKPPVGAVVEQSFDFLARS